MSKISKKTKLNAKQERFCQLYIMGDGQYSGNATRCYMGAYGTEEYNSAKVSASKLLTNANISQRIQELLEKAGLNDENVSKHHLFLLNQFADLKVKMRAIENYYKLRGMFSQKEPEKPKDELLMRKEISEMTLAEKKAYALELINK